MPLTERDVSALMRGIAPAIKTFFAKAMEPVTARLDAVGARMDALERRFNELPPPLPGRDGRDADPAMVLGLVREQVAREMAQIPKPKDGLGFDHLEVRQDEDDPREVVFRFSQGERVRAFPVRVPGFVYHGVWRESGPDPSGTRCYLAGSAVTWGGSLFIAKVNRPQGKPGEESSDWQLAVKRGASGKDHTPPRPLPETVKAPGLQVKA